MDLLLEIIPTVFQSQTDMELNREYLQTLELIPEGSSLDPLQIIQDSMWGCRGPVYPSRHQPLRCYLPLATCGLNSNFPTLMGHHPVGLFLRVRLPDGWMPLHPTYLVIMIMVMGVLMEHFPIIHGTQFLTLVGESVSDYSIS